MRIDGRYELGEPLGEGSAARVLRARDLNLGREVAVKLLHAEGMLADTDRLLGEARTMAQLRHPRILEVLDLGVHEGRPFLVTELVEGGSLEDLLRAGPLPPREAERLCRDVLEALVHAHQAGVLHRDIKPANVLLDAEGRPKLGDFGLARVEAAPRKTATGIILGTLAYAAPEVLMGEPATRASDVYSFGCLCHAVAVGEPPFQGGLGAQVQGRRRGPVDSPQLVGALAEVVRRATHPEPGRRPAGRELAQVFAQVADSGAFERAQVARTRRVGARTRRRPAAATPRGEATQATPAARPRAGPGARPGVAAPLLVAAAVLGLSAWLASPRGPGPAGPGPAGPPASGEARAPTAAATAPPPRPASPLLRTWRARLAGDQLEGQVRAILGAAEPEGIHHQAGMLTFFSEVLRLVYQRRTSWANQAQLSERIRTLPWQHELHLARDELTLHLADADVPLAERLELYTLLRKLAAADAAFAAWSLPRPFRAADLLDTLVPISITSVVGPLPPAQALTPGVPAAPGRHLLFRWPEAWDRAHPVLLLAPGVDSKLERAGLGQLQREVDRRFDPEAHREVQARAWLDPALPVTLELWVGDLRPPTMLEVSWNDQVLPVDALLDGAVLWHWVGEPPSQRVRIGLPQGLVRAGENHLQLRALPLPGTPPVMGLNVHRVDLVVGPAGSAARPRVAPTSDQRRN